MNSIKSRIRKHEENILFLKRLFSNPKSLGAIAPSSKALANLISQYISISKDDYIVEIGAGTGRFTKSFLEAGLDVNNLFVIEIDPEMCAYLRRDLPNVNVIQGDACDLWNLLPPSCHGRVKTIISGIPLINLSVKKIEKIVNACFSIMHPEGKLLQFTYGPLSPIPAKKLGLKKKRLRYVLNNLPPATIWQYKKSENKNIHLP